MTAASKKRDKDAVPKSQKTSSTRIRKILQPAKRGTVSRSVIRKAVQEIIEERSAI